jgi:cytochrome c peroxidase
LVNAWDAIVAYEQTIRSPISPLAGVEDPQIERGRQLFSSNNCQQCHGGPKWSVSAISGPVADISEVAAGQIIAQLRNVGTFNPEDINEVRANGAVPPLGEAGFVPPSLLSVFMSPPYFHNGGASSLDDAMGDRFIAHRAAGTGGIDGLASPDDRAALVRFLLSIDASTEPINP